MIKRCVILMLLVICIAGCATTENFEQHYRGWIGGNVQELLNAWGQPAQVISLSNGNREYVYQLSRYTQLPDACVIYFEVDRDTKNIIRIRHEGDRCKRAPSIV